MGNVRTGMVCRANIYDLNFNGLNVLNQMMDIIRLLTIKYMIIEIYWQNGSIKEDKVKVI